MFTGRDEQVRYEQNKDFYRQAEAQRLAKQLPQSGRNFASISDAFAWLRSQIFRFKSTPDAQSQALEIEHAASQSDVSFAQPESLSTQH